MIKPQNLFISLILSTVLLGRLRAQNVTFDLKILPQDVNVIVGKQAEFNLVLSGFLDKELSVNFTEEHEEYVRIEPSIVKIRPNIYNETVEYPVVLSGIRPGHFDLPGEVQPNGVINDDNIFLRITVAMSNSIRYISLTIGWIYFVAWSVSFWPQIVINFKRKSVVGLSFDYLSMNLLGHSLYAVFNMMLFWNSYVENEYFSRHKRGLNPVIANDVGFSIHATLATALTVFQCFIYEKGEQRVSYTARSILGIFSLTIIISGILVGTDTLHLLDFLYILSYIKLAITLIKYVPQAVLNYRRKSTDGWSIENILLDFTGGLLSMLQMILNAYNYEDWASIFGDPTKFGLGLFSVLFDILFIIQHYVLYKDNIPYNEILGEIIVGATVSEENPVPPQPDAILHDITESPDAGVVIT